MGICALLPRFELRGRLRRPRKRQKREQVPKGAPGDKSQKSKGLTVPYHFAPRGLAAARCRRGGTKAPPGLKPARIVESSHQGRPSAPKSIAVTPRSCACALPMGLVNLETFRAPVPVDSFPELPLCEKTGTAAVIFQWGRGRIRPLGA